MEKVAAVKRLFLLLALFACVCGEVSAAVRPNLIFVLSDDLAQGDLGCYGQQLIQTPHLDRLAAAGARFNHAFVTNSICTPSRAVVLTGKYSHANGTPVFNVFDGGQPTVAKMLQAAATARP